MKAKDFIKEFKESLPISLPSSIDLDNIESSVLLWIGEQISKMSDEAANWYDTTVVEVNDKLIDIVAKKYNLEW